MTVAYGVLGIYAALVVWLVLLGYGYRTKRYWPFLGFGLAIAIFLNGGYFINGQPDSIASFIGIYDVFDNLGLGASGADALATCPDNACSVWGDRYAYHPSWGVAFHERFLTGPQLRTNLLYGHILCNTVAFVILHYQLYRPGHGSNATRHRLLGRVSFGFLTAGTVCAVWLASEHRSVPEYGGVLAMLGFFSMSAFVYGTAVMSIRAIKSGDTAAHRIWSIRYAGSMWGSFWIFRVMLVVTGPLLRNFESVSLLLSIWLSAPLGILLAERIRLRRKSGGSTAILDEPLVQASATLSDHIRP